MIIRGLVLATAAMLAACDRGSHGTSEISGPAFRDAATESGLSFTHVNGAKGEFHLPEIMGSGVALLDYDGDGDLDIYFVQGDPSGGGNRMYRNELVPLGRLQFTDVTRETGTGASGWGMGVAVGDYDRDGDPDLLVTNVGRNVLFRNDKGTFANVATQAGVASDGWHTSAAFLDYDRDGDLDLYICRYVDFSANNVKKCRGPGGEPDYCSPKAYRPVTDRLFQNHGDGSFAEVSPASGIARIAGPGLGVIAGDFNGDQWPDLYVANDGEANYLWINDRNGTFRNVALEAGVAFSEDGMPQAGMGIAAGDYDNDGDEDLAVTNLTREGATLYRNDSNAFFTDVSAGAGLRRLTFGHTGFGVGWLDFNSDGCLDLFLTNGAVTVIDSQRGEHRPFRQPSQLLAGNCKSFAQVGSFPEEVGRGAAFGDMDNDGDVDVVVANNGGSARLLLNSSQMAKQWLQVQAVSGARVTATSSKGNRVRTVRSEGSYLSASEPAAYFAGSPIDTVEIEWPDGTRETWRGVRMNRRFIATRGTGTPSRR